MKLRTASSPLRLLLLPPLAAAVLAGCGGGDDDLHTAGIARSIARTVFEQRHQRVTATCPPTVPKERGYRFTCTVRLEVGTYPVTVTQTDDRGNVTYGSTAPLVVLDIAEVKHAIGVSIRHQRHLGSDVTCPEQVLQKAGVTFICTAAIEGGAVTKFRVTQTDDHGNVRYVGL